MINQEEYRLEKNLSFFLLFLPKGVIIYKK